MTEPTESPPSPTPPPTGGWQPPSSGTSDFGVPVAAGPAPGVAYADLVQRIIAIVIDGLVLGIGYAILWGVVVATLFAVGSFGGALIGVVVGGVLYLVASAIYFIYTWTKMRASPGQRILGLEVVNASDGSTITQPQAVRRWLFLWGPSAVATVFGYTAGTLGALGFVVSLAAFIYLIYLLYTASQSPKRQGFHDVQSNTVVIKRS